MVVRFSLPLRDLDSPVFCDIFKKYSLLKLPNSYIKYVQYFKPTSPMNQVFKMSDNLWLYLHFTLYPIPYSHWNLYSKHFFVSTTHAINLLKFISYIRLLLEASVSHSRPYHIYNVLFEASESIIHITCIIYSLEHPYPISYKTLTISHDLLLRLKQPYHIYVHISYTIYTLKHP